MIRRLILPLLLLAAAAVGLSPLFGSLGPLPTHAQEATETPPAPEATAEPGYAWCGYLLLENVIVGEDELALLAALFPADDGTAAPNVLMQWRPRPDGNGGILEGCHLLPVERWRVVSLLQQASGMDYGQMDAALGLSTFPDAAAVQAYLETFAAEWEAPLETPE